MTPPLILLELRFKTLKRINNLPHYHGAHWSALFRNLLRSHLPHGSTLSSAQVWVHPVECGVLAYDKDDPIHVGLTFPNEHAPAISKALQAFNNMQSDAGGHFLPGKTIFLGEVFCRIAGKEWDHGDDCCLSEDVIQDEAEALSKLDRFSIHFHSPLRLPRPGGKKEEGHHYCDADFFINTESEDNDIPLNHLLQRIRLPDAATASADSIRIHDGVLMWLDAPYGSEVSKTLGGVVGKLFITGRPTEHMAKLLALGQYTGVGKNPAFGLGFYTIPEIAAARKIMSLSRGFSLLRRAVQVPVLKQALSRLPNSSPGPDMVTVTDAIKAGDTFLKIVRDGILQGTYRQGGLKSYRMPKSDGAFRKVFAQNVTDRIVHRAVADSLSPIIDQLLSNSSYAYRRGLNRKGAASALKAALLDGFTSGLKADVSAFFDSVDLDITQSILEALFPFDSLPEQLAEWLKEAHTHGAKGLPQGSPLSPLLGNLYLDRFDKDMEREGFRLFRYGDDFVVLYKKDQSHEEGVKLVEKSLARLGLSLKESKTTEIQHGIPISFLGYVITPDEIIESGKEPEKSDDGWLPVFRDEWRDGRPVYLTSLCRGAYSSGPSLVVKTGEDTTENIPWSSICRIVVVGRSQFSGGVVYRAVKEEVPVAFIDIMGRSRGHLYPECPEHPEIGALQAKYANDAAFCLAYAKEIIAAKIHNSMVILKRRMIDSSALKDLENKVLQADTIESLRGFEGAAARVYFEELGRLVAPFKFKGRIYHPPDGPVNVMLSLGYTLLYNRLAAVLRDKGFNARCGFFHQGRGSHFALASDLLEMLRHVAERVMLSLIHKNAILKEDFDVVKRGEKDICRMGGEGFRKFIHRFEVTMAQKMSFHGGERISYNAYLDEMADNLKRTLKLGIPYKSLRID